MGHYFLDIQYLFIKPLMLDFSPFQKLQYVRPIFTLLFHSNWFASFFWLLSKHMIRDETTLFFPRRKPVKKCTKLVLCVQEVLSILFVMRPFIKWAGLLEHTESLEEKKNGTMGGHSVFTGETVDL